RRDDERRNVFAEGGATLCYRESSDAHVLMKHATAAEKRTVADADVATQQTIIRDDDVVSDFAVVTDVRPNHEKIVIADFGDASLSAAAMNRAMLANHIFVTNRDIRFAFGRK